MTTLAAHVDGEQLTADPDRCQGHNRCCVLAPGRFDIDERGYSTPSAGQVRGPRPLPSPFPPHRTGR